MNYRRIFKITAIAGFAFLMQSCFVAKTYERPEVEETEGLYRTDELPQDSTSMADISWEELFTDPYLQDYIRKGLENNLDVRIAIQQIAAAEAYMKQGKAGYFPTLSAGADVSRQYLAKNSQFGSFFSGHIDQFQLTGNLSWEADIWGKIRSNRRAFLASYLQTVAAHQAVKTELIASIASSYYQLLALDQQLKITEETIENRESSLETTKALKVAGSVTEVGVKQTEAQLHTAEALLVDIKANIKIMENTLSILLGEMPHTIERGKLENQSIDTELKVGVPAQLLQNRPDVMASEYGLVNAFELTNVAKSNFYPSLTLTATGGFQSVEFSKWFDSGSLFATLASGLTQPIFNQRKIRSEYEASQARQETSLLEFKQTLLNAGKEVSDALYTYEAETEKIDIRKKELDAYTLATEYSEELLNNGMINYLEVLTAKEQALNSELSYIDSRFQQLNAIITLYKALGGGWK
ncbi:efflux transporter outer membrane subunit [Sinomicrobium weinanense]|uniref:TolC family protein n=1 Tax=Sinomicrobium weinanense TaxID=2842200 RepID=A0A926JNP9_9FLAO|nr:TolC family protein [Sinomicrobium weinanense]MBC9794487.1 TolC family protein [Sinomicrobium weinanense]MBU3124394.1 TolC family protein [Sinomicrobium weinanense]